MKKLLRVTYYLGIILLFLIIAVAGFTQTRIFRSYLHSVIEEEVARGTRGTLVFGDIHGNLITGFRIEKVEALEADEPFFTADRLEFRYDPLGFFLKRITLARISIENPRIRVVRSVDGSWNIDRFFKPTPPDSASSSWIIDLKRVELINGTFTLIDSSVGRKEPSSRHTAAAQFDYGNIELSAVTLEAAAKIGSRETSLNIHRLSLRSSQPQFVLDKLNGEVSFSSKRTRVTRLSIVTGLSRLSLDGTIDGNDLTRTHSLVELKNAPIKLDLQMDQVDLGELRMFLGGSLDFLDRRLAGEVKASGTLGALNIETVTVRTPRSFIRFHGTMSNLHEPERLELDLAAADNRIDPEDALEYLPGLSIPDLRHVGAISYNLNFKGKPEAFRVQFNGSSRAGKVWVDGGIDLREAVASYDAVVKTTDLDVGALLSNEDMTSKLDATISIKGSGTNVKTMSGVLRAEVDSSEFYGLPMRRSVVVVDVSDGVVRPRLQANVGLTRIDVSGTIGLRRDDSLSYRFEGNINSLNLANVLRSRVHESDLSFGFESHGAGSRWSDLSGALKVSFLRSSYGRHQFQKGTLIAELRPVNARQQEFHLTSDVADLDIAGEFTLRSFISILEEGARFIYHSVDHRFSTLDSLRAFSPQDARRPKFQTNLLKEASPIHATYNLNFKNLFPLGAFFGKDLTGAFSWRGDVTSEAGVVRLGGEAFIPYLHYAERERSVDLQETHIKYAFGGLSFSSAGDSLEATVAVRGASFEIDSLSFANFQVGLVLAGDSANYHLSTLIDSTVTVQAEGTSHDRSGFISLFVPQAKVSIHNYTLENIDPLKIRVGRDGFQIQEFEMRHEGEEFSAAGYFNPSGVSDVRLSLRNFVLNNIRNFARQAPATGTALDFGGMVHAEGQFRGSFDHPNMNLTVNAIGFRHRETVFGEMKLRLSYFERLLNVFTELRSKPNDPAIPPDLLVSGSVPYDFSFTSKKAQKLEGQMDLEVRTKGFRLEFLDPFLPVLRNLSGTMVCDMKMRGTVQSPSYEGSMSIQNARFLFEPMNMQFIVDGQFLPRERQIALQNVTVKNISQDRSDGSVSLSGTFTLEGLRIKDFDLQADGQLLIMKESARRSGQSFFGDLFGATGLSGLRWHGTPERSYLAGRVLVKGANLTFPQTREQQDLPTRRIPVTLVLDTASGEQPTIAQQSLPNRSLALSNGAAYPDAGSHDSLEAHKLNSFEVGNGTEGRASEAAMATSESFLDRIVYDLAIETQGVTQIRFIFNNLTNEELFADLKGNATFTKEGPVTRLNGEVEVGNRSYYNFLKKLEASGKIIFTGNPLNPELNVVARYEGVYQGKDTTSVSLASTSVGDGSASPPGRASQAGDQKVVVTLTITGTRDKPEVKTELKRYDYNGTELPDRADAEADAISFLLTGQFRDDLTQQERRSLIGGNMLYGFTSSVLSGPLSDLLRKEFGVIKSVDVLYYGGRSFQETADVRLTGEVGDAVIRLGGKVFSGINNTNVSVQLPMSGLLGSERWRNLVLEFERRVEGVESIDQRRELQGVKVLYRIVF